MTRTLCARLLRRSDITASGICLSLSSELEPFGFSSVCQKTLPDHKGQAGSPGGETGIRTLGPASETPVFKTGAFDRSAISPRFFKKHRDYRGNLESFKLELSVFA